VYVTKITLASFCLLYKLLQDSHRPELALKCFVDVYVLIRKPYLDCCNMFINA